MTLSGDEQQMLAIARALGRDLALLLLDEPYEGLTIIVVEQNALAALNVADRAVILDEGQVVFTGSAAELLADADLRREHLAL